MQRIPAIDTKQATGKTRALLDRIEEETGLVNNQVRTMAVSPAVLEAFLAFDRAMTEGVLPDSMRARIALAVAQIVGCEYSLALHGAMGRMAGLSGEEIQDSRRGVSPDRKIEAIQQFVRQVVMNHGNVWEKGFARLRRLGCGHEEIAEITANAMLTVFLTHFNIIAGTLRDFPKLPDLAAIYGDEGPVGSNRKPKIRS